MSHTHDPKRTLEALRDHLTHAETNVAFLFGAGTSCAVRVSVGGADAEATRSLIPNVAELTRKAPLPDVPPISKISSHVSGENFMPLETAIAFPAWTNRTWLGSRKPLGAQSPTR